jgi:hypothetical protein
MAATKQTTIRFSPVHRRQLKLLADKLQINEANVIRLAVTRLAEQEGILQTGKKVSEAQAR